MERGSRWENLQMRGHKCFFNGEQEKENKGQEPGTRLFGKRKAGDVAQVVKSLPRYLGKGKKLSSPQLIVMRSSYKK
jgi:hypothetical protein